MIIFCCLHQITEYYLNELDKMLKKISRKLKHCESLLIKYENITFSHNPTASLFVGNGGLECGVTREKLVELFGVYGEIKKIVMLPRKSYSFIVFNTINQSSTIISVLNGKKVSSNCIFYLAFIKDEDVPEEMTLRNDWPSGLVLLEEFINEQEENELLAVINNEDVSTGKFLLKHRKVKHYGYEFIYGSNNINKNQPLEEKIPDVCIPHLKKLVSLKLLPRIPDQLTVNHYLPGQGIPPHVDTHSAFEDGIVSLSLSSQVVMNFYCPQGKTVSVSLPRRSVLIMSGESRYLWRHGITPRKQDIVTSESSGHLTLAVRSPRTSFTFRLVREGECNCDYKEYCDSKMSS